MDKIKALLTKIWKDKKFRYGGVSILLTITIIASVICLNAGFSALADHFNWAPDMTKEKVYNITEQSINLLSSSVKEEMTIEIIFTSTPDQLALSKYAYQVYTLAREYETNFEFIEIVHINLITEPNKVDYFVENDKSVTLSSNSVILARKDSDGLYSMYRIYTLDSFFYYDTTTSYDPYYFKGEQIFTSAIYSLTFAGHPLALFATGHGENTDTSLSEFREVLRSAGFDAQDFDFLINLEFPQSDIPSLLIINAPINDYTPNEIRMLTEAFDSGQLNVLLFIDESRNTPNLFEFASDHGIVYGDIIRDSSNSLPNSGGQKIIAEFSAETIAIATVEGGSADNLGADLTSGLRAMSNPPYIVSDGARQITLDYNGSKRVMLGLYPILETSSNAKTLSGESASASPLLVLGEKQNEVSTSSDWQYSYILAGASTNFISDTYMSGSYANRDVIFSALRSISRGQFDGTVGDIVWKSVDTQALNITEKSATVWTLLLSTVLPIGLLISGGIVYFRRKRA